MLSTWREEWSSGPCVSECLCLIGESTIIRALIGAGRRADWNLAQNGWRRSLVVRGGPHGVSDGEADISEKQDLMGEAVPYHPSITVEDVSERLDLVAIRQRHQPLVDQRTELS